LHFRMIKMTSFNELQLKKNWSSLTRVWPGGPGLRSTRQGDRVSLGQFPSGFLPSPWPVPGPGRPGPRSTRRASPGLKTLGKNRLVSYLNTYILSIGNLNIWKAIC
jgi:hypothetical protein